jgi:hypothetical protein
MICVATNTMKTCSFLWFVCTHVDDDFDILPYVFLPNSPLIASRMLTTFSFKSLERNNMHVFQHEIDTMVFSNFDGVFVFPHLEDVQTICLHIDLAYAFHLLYLCYANCVVNKNGHDLNDMLPYHAHTSFAWSLLCVSTHGYYWWTRSHEWFQSTTSTTRAHQQLCKVTCFYSRTHAINSKNWLLFECFFALLVAF